MTQPKWSGGMGLIRKLQSMNEACLMKLGWSLMIGELGVMFYLENMVEVVGVLETR
jgi:hypothetical protein